MKTKKIAKEKGIEDLFFADLEIHAIRFTEWMSKYGYEKTFIGKKGWASIFELADDDFDARNCKRYTIKDLYKQFMIDQLCL
jgi:hypothetical protein